jgi:hypothetical protein
MSSFATTSLGAVCSFAPKKIQEPGWLWYQQNNGLGREWLTKYLATLPDTPTITTQEVIRKFPVCHNQGVRDANDKGDVYLLCIATPWQDAPFRYVMEAIGWDKYIHFTATPAHNSVYPQQGPKLTPYVFKLPKGTLNV